MFELKNFALFNLEEVTQRDAFRATFENGKWGGENLAIESIASTFQMDRFAAPGFNSAPNPSALPLEFDARFRRQVVEVDVIENAFARYATAVEPEGLLEKVAQFSKSLSEYKAGNYETSLVLAWFVIESTLNALWARHLDAVNGDLPTKVKRINSGRRKALTGRDYTSSVSPTCWNYGGC